VHFGDVTMKKSIVVDKAFIECLQEMFMEDQYKDGILMFNVVMELMGINPEDYLGEVKQ
jgi:hypothetical protein